MAGPSAPHMLDTPLSPTSSTFSSVQSPFSKSFRFKDLFHRRKAVDNVHRPQTHAGESPTSSIHQNSPQIPSLKSRPSIISRTQSDNPRTSRSKTPPVPVRRNFADPPPYMQARSQASLHSSLQVPSTSPRSHSRRDSISDKQSGQASPEKHLDAKRSHKRTVSGQSTLPAREKELFLLSSGHILQYDSEGGGDRLPEKILELNHSSVAFVCDLIPGKPWVLQISSASSRLKDNENSSTKHKWTIFSLRSSDSKRNVNSMLLIFNNSNELYSWLLAVRKEIEQYGGMEYHPDTCGQSQVSKDFTSDCNASTIRLQQSTPEQFTSIADRPREEVAVPAEEERLFAPPVFRTHSMQSTASSTITKHSLDRLRDSMTSDGYPSTIATSNDAGSLAPTSPTLDSFPQPGSPPDARYRALPLRLNSLNDPATLKTLPLAMPPMTLRERRNLSSSSDMFRDGNQERNIAHLTRGDQPAVESKLRHTSLNEVVHSGQPPTATDISKSTITERDASPAVVRDIAEPSSSSECEVVDQPSRASEAAVSSIPAIVKSKYSLFPARTVDSKPEISVTGADATSTSPHPTPRSSRSLERLSGKTDIDSIPADLAHRKIRSRTLTLNLSNYQTVSSRFLAAEFDKPQRSPAVSDAMIMSNFGVLPMTQPQSPLPDSKVPRLCDLAVDLALGPERRRSRSPAQHVTRSSVVALALPSTEQASTIARAPLGPPPTGPLPAVPIPNSVRSTSRGRNRSQSTRKRAGRRSPTPKAVPSSQVPPIVPSTELTALPVLPTAIAKAARGHTRTISGAYDGPPPPARFSSITSPMTR